MLSVTPLLVMMSIYLCVAELSYGSAPMQIIPIYMGITERPSSLRPNIIGGGKLTVSLINLKSQEIILVNTCVFL